MAICGYEMSLYGNAVILSIINDFMQGKCTPMPGGDFEIMKDHVDTIF